MTFLVLLFVGWSDFELRKKEEHASLVGDVTTKKSDMVALMHVRHCARLSELIPLRCSETWPV